MNEAIEILKTKYHGWKLVLKVAKRTAINENAKLKEKILSQDIFLFNFSKMKIYKTEGASTKFAYFMPTEKT